MEFSEKVVLITGASAGIGEACALKFAKSGALLSLVGRNVENLNKVAEQCEQFCGNKPLAIKADISVAEDVEMTVKETISHFGKIDVLVNNAGVLLMAGIMDDISSFDSMLATNVRGTYLITQKAIPHLIVAKGNIVNVSSIVSNVAVPAIMPYCMTKAALDMFTKCLALDLGPKGVRVNAVNPGPVNTALFKRNGINDEVNNQMFENIAAALPLRKVSTSEDVAELVAFLASDKASSITGSRHEIDCGLHLGDPVLRA
ncbi:3-oxoacyl-[acyl-carrier-protein] reductase FabG-like [Epargyreus clarus]|uniref:3-oxoacyl-[acyl-carrier-protein] reductase FabG-like n=1 Tax=Epargyreus clarus TaxID=520877 RepID=UPI003C304BB0